MDNTIQKSNSQFFSDGANIDANYGPWGNVLDYYDFISNNFDINEDEVLPGTIIAIKEDGDTPKIILYVYQESGEWQPIGSGVDAVSKSEDGTLSFKDKFGNNLGSVYQISKDSWDSITSFKNNLSIDNGTINANSRQIVLKNNGTVLGSALTIPSASYTSDSVKSAGLMSGDDKRDLDILNQFITDFGSIKDYLGSSQYTTTNSVKVGLYCDKLSSGGSSEVKELSRIWIPKATTTLYGMMSPAMVKKLDTLLLKPETVQEDELGTIGYKFSLVNLTLPSSAVNTITTIQIPLATDTTNGMMSSEDKNKLDKLNITEDGELSVDLSSYAGDIQNAKANAASALAKANEAINATSKGNRAYDLLNGEIYVQETSPQGGSNLSYTIGYDVEEEGNTRMEPVAGFTINQVSSTKPGLMTTSMLSKLNDALPKTGGGTIVSSTDISESSNPSFTVVEPGFIKTQVLNANGDESYVIINDDVRVNQPTPDGQAVVQHILSNKVDKTTLASTTRNGLMTTDQVSKLYNTGITSSSSSNGISLQITNTPNSQTGAPNVCTIPNATTTASGLMTATDKVKLNSVDVKSIASKQTSGTLIATVTKADGSTTNLYSPAVTTSSAVLKLHMLSLSKVNTMIASTVGNDITIARYGELQDATFTKYNVDLYDSFVLVTSDSLLQNGGFSVQYLSSTGATSVPLKLNFNTWYTFNKGLTSADQDMPTDGTLNIRFCMGDASQNSSSGDCTMYIKKRIFM